MSSEPTRHDLFSPEPDDDSQSIECYVSMRKLTDEEIEKWTKCEIRKQIGKNCSISSEPEDPAFSLLCDSELSTIEDSTHADGEVNGHASSSRKWESASCLSLFDDDEVIGIDLDANLKKKIQALDKSTIPEKLISRFNTQRRKSGSTFPLFCLFCLKEHYNVHQAILCHYRQSKHFPYRCLECEEVTLDVKGMAQHYNKTHPTLARVQYRRTFAPAKERWVRKFVTYQLKCLTHQATMIPNSILHRYCPVCNQWDYKMGEKNPKNKSQHKVFNMLDRNHINKHLKYHPFQCTLCLNQGSRFDLTIINQKARNHLITHHGFTEPNEQDLKDNFCPFGTIPELERYINSYVKYVQESFVKGGPPISPISDTADSPAKNLLSTPSKSLPSSSSTALAKQSTPLSTLSTGKKGRPPGKATKPASKVVATSKRKKLTEYSIDDMYYPSPKYSRREYSRYPKNGKSHSRNNDYSNSVIDLDSFFEDSVSPYSKLKQPPRIICIFCNNMQNDFLAAWDHYAIHLNYRPISCQLCSKTFPGPKAFQLHGADHVDHDSLPYQWNHNSITESWISDFLNFIGNNDSVANSEFTYFCFICCKKFQKQQLPQVNPPKLCFEDIRKHILLHLRYQPYHCNLCSGDRIYISDLENDGPQHLTLHQITCSKDALPKYFTRSQGIDTLDIFLTEHFNRVRRYLNMPDDNCINGDATMSVGALCDVELLFNSLQETLGHNTLNDILDNVSQNGDHERSHVSSSDPVIDQYPVTPTSTTSDPTTSSSPTEPLSSLPLSPIKVMKISPLADETSEAMVSNQSEIATPPIESGKISPTQNNIVNEENLNLSKETEEMEVDTENDKAPVQHEHEDQIETVNEEEIAENSKEAVEEKVIVADVKIVKDDEVIVKDKDGKDCENVNEIEDDRKDEGVTISESEVDQKEETVNEGEADKKKEEKTVAEKEESGTKEETVKEFEDDKKEEIVTVNEEKEDRTEQTVSVSEVVEKEKALNEKDESVAKEETEGGSKQATEKTVTNEPMQVEQTGPSDIKASSKEKAAANKQLTESLPNSSERGIKETETVTQDTKCDETSQQKKVADINNSSDEIEIIEVINRSGSKNKQTTVNGKLRAKSSPKISPESMRTTRSRANQLLQQQQQQQQQQQHQKQLLQKKSKAIKVTTATQT